MKDAKVELIYKLKNDETMIRKAHDMKPRAQRVLTIKNKETFKKSHVLSGQTKNAKQVLNKRLRNKHKDFQLKYK